MPIDHKPPFGVRVVVALACEAAPIVARYRLQRLPNNPSPLAIYADVDQRHCLIVSGIGSHAATMATAYLAGVSGACKSTAWLNVGIAGAAPEFPLGSLWAANKIIAMRECQRYYPAVLPQMKVPSTTVTTVDHPERNPDQGTLVDMEAAAYYRAASTLATHETVQCLKVVSDHGIDENTAATTPSKAEVQGMIEAQMDGIANAIDTMLELSEDLATRWADPPHYDALLKERHFTVSQAQNRISTGL